MIFFRRKKAPEGPPADVWLPAITALACPPEMLARVGEPFFRRLGKGWREAGWTDPQIERALGRVVRAILGIERVVVIERGEAGAEDKPS